MPTQRTIDGSVQLNLEGHWRRSTYRNLCAENGVEYQEADYLRWREVGERLTGEPCFETQVQRASAAFAQLGVAASQAADQLRKAFSR